MSFSKTLYTLQSGYVSLNNTNFLRDVAEHATFKQQILNQNMDSGTEEYYFNPIITELTHKFMQDHKCIHDFEFRDKLLANVFLAFGCLDIRDWIKAQSSSIFLSDLQKAFIIETLKFVSGGDRTMAPFQWVNLLDTSVSRQSVHFDYEKAFSDDNLPEPVKVNIYDFILQWVSRPGGYEDLVISMWVIFGRRTVKQSMTYPRSTGNVEQARASALASVVAGV